MIKGVAQENEEKKYTKNYRLTSDGWKIVLKLESGSKRQLDFAISHQKISCHGGEKRVLETGTKGKAGKLEQGKELA